MSPFDQPRDTSDSDPDLELCPICRRPLWSDGLEPAQDGDAWICGDCDQARNFTALDP